MLKTEVEARGFQHFPADIKSVTSLLVLFPKQYQFSNKNQFKLEQIRKYISKTALSPILSSTNLRVSF